MFTKHFFSEFKIHGSNKEQQQQNEHYKNGHTKKT